ncbi:MAG: helix-turn-helix transcriptional regulator [Selenomonadaceae bacterium]|nr:helix-turn-helix transcriptional regulator [Selenomonadaceae bacterium]
MLEAELQKRFITDRKLAEALHLGTAEIDRKMTGQSNFSLAQMTAVKDFLGVDMPLEELFRRNPDIKFPGEPCVRHWDTFPVLEAELQRQGIKCAQLAKLLGMSENSVSRRMQGIYEFTPEQKEAIKKFLGVDIPIEELFSRQ